MSYTLLNNPAVGTVKSEVSSSAAVTASGTWNETVSVTLEPGTWVITFGGQFASNSTGYRSITLDEPGNIGRYTPSQPAVNGEATRMNAALVRTYRSTTTVKLYALQNSGSSLNFFGYLMAVRVK